MSSHSLDWLLLEAEAPTGNRIVGRRAEKRRAHEAFDGRQELGQMRIDRDQFVGFHVDAIAWEELIVRVRYAAASDSLPIDWEDHLTAWRRGTRTGDPDVIFGRHRRQSVDLRQGIEHGLMPCDGQPIDLLAVAAAVGDDVVNLAIVGEDVDRQIARVEIRPLVSEFVSDDVLGLSSVIPATYAEP